MNKSIAILAASGLIALGGAAAVSAATGTSTTEPTAALTVDDGTARTTILSEVLAGLVTDGTITQQQSDAIVSALDARRTELRAAREAAREQLRTFLEDGVISAEELAQLPADSPLRSLGSILDDGQITLDELRSLRGAGGLGGFGGFRGHGHFHGLNGDLDAPATTDGESTTTSTS